MSKLKKEFFFVFYLILGVASVFAQPNPNVNYFNLQDIRLLESPFKHAEKMDMKYLLDLKADRLLAPYLREAGLSPKAESYTN